MDCLRKFGQHSTAVVHWGLFQKSNFTRTHSYVCMYVCTCFTCLNYHYYYNKGEKKEILMLMWKSIFGLFTKTHMKWRIWFYYSIIHNWIDSFSVRGGGGGGGGGGGVGGGGGGGGV